jgi:hypothetical protein
MRFRSVLVYSTLLGSVAVGAATAGLDPTALRASLSRWADSACGHLRVDLCLSVGPSAETRSDHAASSPDQVAANRRPWTDPPSHNAPTAARSTWRDSDDGHADAAPSDVATTGGLTERAAADPADKAAGQGYPESPLLSSSEAPSIPAETEEPRPASAPAEPVISSLGVARPDGSKPDGQLTTGPGELPAAGRTADENARDMSRDPAITNSSSLTGLEPDLTPVPFPPMRPVTPVEANLVDPPSPAAGDAAPAERSDSLDAGPKVEGPNAGGTRDRRRTARRMTGPSDLSPAASRGSIRGSRILARTGRDPGPDLRPRRPVQLPARLLPDDLP